MKNKKNRLSMIFFSIRTKMIVCLFLVLALMLAVADTTIYRIYKADVERKEISFIEDNNKIFAENIKNFVKGIEENVMSEVTRCSVFQYQVKPEAIHSAEVRSHLKSMLVTLKVRRIETKSIFVLDRYGNEFFYSADESEEEDLAEKQVYRMITEQGETLFRRKGATIWRRLLDQPEEVYVIKHFVDPSTLEYRGILCLTMDRSRFEKLLGETSFVLAVYDELGDLLYTSDGWPVPEKYEEQDEITGYISETTIVPRKKWTLIEAVSEKKAFASLYVMTRTLLIVESIIFLLMMAVIYLMLKGLLKNIDTLTNHFMRLNKGEQIEDAIPHSHDESAYLCEQFNQLYNRLQIIAEQMAQENTLRERSEYNALMAQMNPHFLYNTLESISSMAKLSGESSIVEAIGRLSHLMRAPLSGQEQEIPLEQELSYINDYLKLQELITGGRISWDIDVDDEMSRCMVPKLLLQPIVENAILHGLDEMLEDGMIVITAERKEKNAVIEVCDNGKGASQKELEQLLNEDAEQIDTDRAHIGVRSIQKRIRMIYGKDYGLEMESAPGNGMVVRIHIPYTGEGKVC